jgi:signal transduction histidine kinase
VQSASDRIEARISTYIALLQATAAMFAVSDHVTRLEFQEYAAQLRVRQRYPGIQGVGFSRRVMADELDDLEREMRAEGGAGFHVWPDSAREEYHAIVALEPLDRRNRAAIGYDMFTQPTRREAMSRARDTGRPAASGRVQLVQEIDERKQAGFLIYVPLYRGAITPPSAEERAKKLDGFIYAPFRADDLFSGIFGREQEPRVEFRIYDGVRAEAPALLHDSRLEPLTTDTREYPSVLGKALVDTVNVEVAGRPWTIVYAPTAALVAASGASTWMIVAIAGIVMSIALFALARIQMRAQAESESVAAEMRALATELEARNRELAAANRSKSDFLATMSHEIRTPINAIVGYTQLLEMGISGPVTAEQASQLARITSSGKHLLTLIDDILDLSRIEADRMRITETIARGGNTVDSALALVRPQAAAKEIELSAQCQGEHDASYVGDEQRVQQILVNLLTNAIKFTPSGGRITVSCGHARRSADGGDPAAGTAWAFFSVEDTGVGIPRAMQQRIFDPFVQAEAGYTRAHAGAGLGLSISRRLARLMGGDLVVESEEGNGSHFTLWLRADGDMHPAPDDGHGRREATPTQAVKVPAPSHDDEGLDQAGNFLHREINTIVDELVREIRARPDVFHNVHELSNSQLEDHTRTWLADIAQSLLILESSGGDPSELMRDGTEIQRLISERHGAQRHRIGWNEQALRREFEILQMLIDRAFGSWDVGQAASERARRIVAGAIRHAEQLSLRANSSASQTVERAGDSQ